MFSTSSDIEVAVLKTLFVDQGFTYLCLVSSGIKDVNLQNAQLCGVILISLKASEECFCQSGSFLVL